VRFTAPRVQFGARPAEDGGPAPLVRRAADRRLVRLAKARDALAVLPGPSEAVHALMTGRYDLMHVLVLLAEQLGTLEHLRIATLSYNARNLAEMLNLLDERKVQALTLLCSAFFRDHNKELWVETLDEFRTRGQQAAAARTHAKVVTLETVAGEKYALEGSANLRSNGNREQLLIAQDAALHDWHADWIDELVTRHAGDAQGE
jgi:hypothetical protein